MQNWSNRFVTQNKPCTNQLYWSMRGSKLPIVQCKVSLKRVSLFRGRSSVHGRLCADEFVYFTKHFKQISKVTSRFAPSVYMRSKQVLVSSSIWKVRLSDIMSKTLLFITFPQLNTAVIPLLFGICYLHPMYSFEKDHACHDIWSYILIPSSTYHCSV